MPTSLQLLLTKISNYKPIGDNENNALKDVVQFIPVEPSKDPIILVLIGAVIALIGGVLFARLMQIKLIRWEKENISPIPVGTPQTIISWIISFIGISLVFSGTLQVFTFSAKNSLLASLIISSVSAITMWLPIKKLMEEVDAGTVKQIDKYL